VLDLRIDAAAAAVDGDVRPASVGVRDGVIVSLAPSEPAAEVVALGPDEVLLPGLVDTHVHIDEPGHSDLEGFASASRAAAAGGVTTLVDMPLDSSPVTTSVAALAAKHAAARASATVHVGFWGGLVPGNLAELPALADAGVRGFKCFLSGSGNPEFPPVSFHELLAGLTACAQLSLPLLVHAEHDDLMTAPSGPVYRTFLASRPDASEVAAVRAVVEAVRRTGGHAHIVHVSTAQCLPLIAAAKAEGLPVTAETCPHYLALAAEDVPDGATEFACWPPVRPAANADELWAALSDGTIDMIVSDHSPAPAAAKLTGDFGTARGGISSLQLGLCAVWTAGAPRGLPLAEIAGWMSAAPAALAGYGDRGRIAIGLRGDLTSFDTSAVWRVDPHRLRHRQPVTAYAGRTLTGRVGRTWLAGRELALNEAAVHG
jgi:allantoinase